MAICMAAGMPTRKIFPKMGISAFSALTLTLTQLFSRSRITSTRTAETAWEMMVARATPSTPILNRSTNTRSSTVLTRAQATSSKNGRLESPTARNIPEPIL